MLIAIEGIDAAGKDTQARLLKTRLDALGLSVEILSFPRYGETLFAASVADYLNGKFGELHSVDPHLSALLYAGDRFESRDVIRRLAARHDVLVLDRYVASNLAYQAARAAPEERPGFVAWLARIEFEIYGLPRPDLNIYLDVPSELAAQLLYKKKQRAYTAAAADLYEQDTNYLATCREVYHSLANAGDAGEWVTVECSTAEGHMCEVAEISDLIWKCIEPRLEKPEC